MKIRKFRPGLKYVFTTKRFKRDANRIGLCLDNKRSWFKDCSGIEVNVIDSFNGKVKGYNVSPEWCKVISNS